MGEHSFHRGQSRRMHVLSIVLGPLVLVYEPEMVQVSTDYIGLETCDIASIFPMCYANSDQYRGGFHAQG